MKKNRLFLINLILLAFLILIYSLAKYILKLNDMAFMNIVISSFRGIFLFLSVLALIQVMIVLYKNIINKNINLISKMIAAIGIGISIISIVFILIYSLSGIGLGSRFEHVVEKDGIKMVANVDSFMEVNVKYYDYVNRFIRGNRLKIFESYGNGGYNPFELEMMPEVKGYIYYNDEGEVIKSSYK